MSRNSSAWQHLRQKRIALAQATGEPCIRCGQAIDYTAPYKLSDGHINPGYPTVDHLDPTAHGHPEITTPDRLAPAHWRCNSRHGGKLGRAKQLATQRAARAVAATATGPTATASPKRKQNAGNLENPVSPAMISLGEQFTAPTPPDPIYPGGYREPPEMPPPRFATPRHPHAVGTYGPEALQWITQRRAADDLVPDDEKAPIPAWAYILDRALEYDVNGALCWRVVVMSVPRQSTKSTLMAELMAWRLHQADRFGERQIIVHTANRLQAAFRIQEELHSWARDCGYAVLRRTGQERITLPDHSRWEITSLTAAYGSRSAMAFVDEAFDVPLSLVEKALLPAQARRRSAQIWLVSTANSACTELMPKFRSEGFAGGGRTCLLEWGLPDDADPYDSSAWPWSNPWPTPEYLAEVSANVGSDDWLGQWLNVWPPMGPVRPTGWLPAEVVALCARPAVSPTPLVAAIEVASDQVTWAACVSDGVSVATLPVAESLDAAVRWLRARRPHVVLAHRAVLNRLPADFAELRAVQAHEMAAAVSLLADRVRAGAVMWDHGDAVAAQVSRVVLGEVEGLRRIVDARSRGPVPVVKAMSWAVWAAGQSASLSEPPAVF